MLFETLKVNREGAVLFVGIAAPPMNLLGLEKLEKEGQQTKMKLMLAYINPELFPALTMP